jgi:hypothetical protein
VHPSNSEIASNERKFDGMENSGDLHGDFSHYWMELLHAKWPQEAARAQNE